MEEQHKKVFLKMTQIARMRCRGYKDTIIASHFGLSQGGLSRIVADSTYQEIEKEVLSSLNQKLDDSLINEHEKLKKNFEKMVPFAMQALVDTVLQNRDLKSKLAAAEFIFDRDPNKTFVSGPAAGGTGAALPQGLLSQLDVENKGVVADVPKPRVN